MNTTEDKDAERKERDAQRKREDEKSRRREARSKRIKDIGWTTVLASVITVIVVTSLGWLTTQGVVEQAREEGKKELVALRASICLVRFQQMPNAEEKLTEFKVLSWNEQKTAINKFVTDEGLATMLGEDEPAPTAVEKCAEAIKSSL
ncbi:MAG: hypothetical protein WD673_04900 [Alphaproteobacteria bacterium]